MEDLERIAHINTLKPATSWKCSEKKKISVKIQAVKDYTEVCVNTSWNIKSVNLVWKMQIFTSKKTETSESNQKRKKRWWEIWWRKKEYPCETCEWTFTNKHSVKRKWYFFRPQYTSNLLGKEKQNKINVPFLYPQQRQMMEYMVILLNQWLNSIVGFLCSWRI